MISLLCPTRNRPEQLLNMIGSAHRSATYNVEIVCYFDEDDHSSDPRILPVVSIVGPRICLSDMWNKCAEAAQGDLLMMCNDDVIFRTPGWDDMVEAAFERRGDKILMVHGSPTDKPEHCGFAAHPVIHRKWVDTVGYFTWPYFSGDYADTFIDWIARQLGRVECLPYALEHIHPLFQKGADDQTYRDRRVAHTKDNPTTLWENSLPDRMAAVEKLRKVMR